MAKWLVWIPDWTPDRVGRVRALAENWVVFFGKALYSHSARFSPRWVLAILETELKHRCFLINDGDRKAAVIVINEFLTTRMTWKALVCAFVS